MLLSRKWHYPWYRYGPLYLSWYFLEITLSHTWKECLPVKLNVGGYTWNLSSIDLKCPYSWYSYVASGWYVDQSRRIGACYIDKIYWITSVETNSSMCTTRQSCMAHDQYQHIPIYAWGNIPFISSPAVHWIPPSSYRKRMKEDSLLAASTAWNVFRCVGCVRNVNYSNLYWTISKQSQYLVTTLRKVTDLKPRYNCKILRGKTAWRKGIVNNLSCLVA